MKKAMRIVCILLAVLLLFPFPIQQKDGGTVVYAAALYKVYDVHRADENAAGGFREGIVVEILGIEVFNNVK